MRGIPHHLIDTLDPKDHYSVAQFQQDARREIDSCTSFPIIAGGTGLYVDALVYDYHFTDDVKKTCSDRTEMCANFVLVGLKWPRDVLRARLLERSHKLFAQDIESECLRMVEQYGWDSQAMKSDIYPIVWEMMRGNISREEAIRLNATDDWHLAKRQLTWFKRNKNINWLELATAKDWILKYYSKN